MPIIKNSPIRIMDFRSTYKGGGGPDKTILNSAAQHDPEKVDILVTYLRDPNDHEYSIDKWAQKLGIKYVDVPDARLVDFKCINMLKKIVDKHDIQLVHSHDAKTLLYGWFLKKKRSHLRLMYTVHLHSTYNKDDFPNIVSYLRFRLRQKISILLMRQYQKPLLAVSQHTRQSVIRDGISAQDIKVLYNGIDIKKWKRDNGKPVLREELNIPDDVALIGTVARIAARHKDLPTFYRVAAMVRKQFAKVKFVIVGDGLSHEMQRAQQEVKALGLDDFLFFTGHRTDLLDIYSSFDVFLMTSITEGLPNTLLEAMAMNVPVVSTAVAGVPELVVHGQTGLLSPMKDAKQLSDHVLRLLMDPLFARKIALAARQRIEAQFSFSDRVKKMEEYYSFFVERSY